MNYYLIWLIYSLRENDWYKSIENIYLKCKIEIVDWNNYFDQKFLFLK